MMNALGMSLVHPNSACNPDEIRRYNKAFRLGQERVQVLGDPCRTIHISCCYSQESDVPIQFPNTQRLEIRRPEVQIRVTRSRRTGLRDICAALDYSTIDHSDSLSTISDSSSDNSSSDTDVLVPARSNFGLAVPSNSPIQFGSILPGSVPFTFASTPMPASPPALDMNINNGALIRTFDENNPWVAANSVISG